MLCHRIPFLFALKPDLYFELINDTVNVTTPSWVLHKFIRGCIQKVLSCNMMT